jgi:hypothetical protein
VYTCAASAPTNSIVSGCRGESTPFEQSEPSPYNHHLQYEAKLAKKDSEISKREAAILEKQIAVAKAEESLEEQVKARLTREREKIATEEAKKARLFFSEEISRNGKEVSDLQEILKARELKLTEAQKAQAGVLRKERELDDAKRELDLTIVMRVQESLSTVRDKARHDAEEVLKLKVAEKEQTIAGMQRQIEELKRKAEQGSQQLQGEVLELDMEAQLKAKFGRDTIEPVPKGQFGGDIIQRVVGPHETSADRFCGSRSERKTGATGGLRNFETISERQKLIWL